MTNISCGIDFGTTNSAISICDQEVKLIEVEDSKLTIPTAIFYPSDKITTPIYGRRALNNYIAGESGRFMRSLKRILGTDLMDNATSINGKSMMFTDIISDFIKHIKTNSEKQLNKNIENVVIGRPIHFSDGNIKNDNKAVAVMTKIANQVGFKNVDFQYEPIAAAFAHEQSIKDEKLAFVIDIGGGTSDFTVIKIGAKLKDKIDRSDDIISNHGICLGGNDLDKDLSINSFMPELGLGSFHTNKLGRTLPFQSNIILASLSGAK